MGTDKVGLNFSFIGNILINKYEKLKWHKSQGIYTFILYIETDLLESCLKLITCSLSQSQSSAEIYLSLFDWLSGLVKLSGWI